MAYKIFPAKRYELISAYEPSQVMEILSANTDARKMFTVDVLSAVIEKSHGGSSFFEGEINESTFTINHKEVRVFRSNMPSVRPIIDGSIHAVNNNTLIVLNISAGQPIYLIFVLLFPLIGFFQKTPEALIFLGECIAIIAVFLIVLFLRFSYKFKSIRYKEHLKHMLNATEKE